MKEIFIPIAPRLVCPECGEKLIVSSYKYKKVGVASRFLIYVHPSSLPSRHSKGHEKFECKMERWDYLVKAETVMAEKRKTG